MKFTYNGPLDEVDVHLTVRRGDTIDVPESVAGRPYSEQTDAEGNVLERDYGTGLLAQPDAWTPEASTLESLTVKQLEAVAAERNVDLTGVTKKADIVAAINSKEG